MHRPCGIHPRNDLSTQQRAKKTDQGKKERFFAEKWRKIPMEANFTGGMKRRSLRRGLLCDFTPFAFVTPPFLSVCLFDEGAHLVMVADETQE
jgi:hypothetical protein